MTNLLGAIKRADKVEEVKDVLGGSKFAKVESGIYAGTIKYAYLKPSSTGALGMHMEVELEDGAVMQESIYLTNSQGENFYLDKQDDKKKHLLPGYITADEIALFGAQKPIAELDTEGRIIKLRDYDLQQDVPTEVPMLVDLVGKPVQLGILKIIEDKKIKTEEIGANGKPVYKATGETRTINQIDKVFHPTNNMTAAELRAGAEEPSFYDAWKEKNAGKVRDLSTGAGAGTGGKPAAKTKAATSSLFK